jgi:hypothetical protein
MIEANNKAELYEILQERYQIGRTALINRLNLLNFKAKKAKDRAWFDEKEIEILDSLKQWQDTDQGTISEFIEQNVGAIAKIDSKIEKREDEISLDSNPVNVYMGDGGIKQMAQIMAIAQEKAGGILIAERVLTAQYLANPDLLNDELQAKLAEYDEKCLPASINAEDFAKKLIEEFN